MTGDNRPRMSSVAVGGAKNVKPERIRNDMVDATLAAYATYFQGFLSDDTKAKEIYDEAKAVLRFILAVPQLPDHVVARSRRPVRELL